MIKHIVAWNLKDGVNESEKENIKSKLEGLKDKIDYLVDIDVNIESLESSDRKIVLTCLFEKEADLKAYQVNEEHVKVSGYVKSVTDNRVCIDYIE